MSLPPQATAAAPQPDDRHDDGASVEAVSRLPLERRVLVAADEIARAGGYSRRLALRRLASVYWRAAQHAISDDLTDYLRASAEAAHQLADEEPPDDESPAEALTATDDTSVITPEEEPAP